MKYAGTKDDGKDIAVQEDITGAVSTHNADGAAHGDIRGAVSDEATARQAADTALQTGLSAHTGDKNNPHEVSLQQAADTQASTPAVLGSDLYRGSQIESNRLLTKQEILSEMTAVVTGNPLYMGQLKYGADTVATMNTIPLAAKNYGLTVGDLCGVQETQRTYLWDGAAWQPQPNGQDAVGQYYDILKWWGTWIDGLTYYGDVTASIRCRDAENHLWDLIVHADEIVDGEITDEKIGDRTLQDSAGDAGLIAVAAKNLTAWLQGIRNNLKYLFSALNGKQDVEAGKGLSTNDFTDGYRALMDFIGDMTVTTLTNIPVTKSVVYANIGTNQALSMNGQIPHGSCIHVLIKNTSSGQAVIAIPNAGSYSPDNEPSLTIAANGRAELNIVHDYNESLTKIIVR